MKRSATIPTPAIPPTNGHLPFAVQAAEQTRERADQLAETAREHTTSHSARAVAQLDANQAAMNAAGLGSTTLDEFFNVVRKQVAESTDPDGTLGAIAQLIISHCAKTDACPIYRDCDQTGPHYDHSGFGLLKVADETGQGTLIDAGMVALSGRKSHATVCLGNAEFDNAASVRQKTAELRVFLNHVDQLADRVFTDHQAHS
ncbi:hypothetical protein [Streptomyces sp. NPDC020489]|uniref:hypothetical protein n=1 Tax=Streptomyces sp. NPDC020489 TaxID=3365077 RepID=UPI0037BC12D8